MALEKPYADVPGTTIFDADMLRKGYHLNQSEEPPPLSMPNFISEDDIELALLQRLQNIHGFDTLDCFTADLEDLADESGRNDKRKVILEDRLSEAGDRHGASRRRA